MAQRGIHTRRMALWGMMLLLAIGVALTMERCALTPGARLDLGPGRDTTVGQVQGADLKLVTEVEGKPARLLGTLTNSSDTSVEVTVRDADDTATIAVSAGESFSFTDSPTIFTTIDAAIGGQASMTFVAPGETQDVLIPVYEGPIGGYVHYTSDVDAM